MVLLFYMLPRYDSLVSYSQFSNVVQINLLLNLCLEDHIHLPLHYGLAASKMSGELLWGRKMDSLEETSPVSLLLPPRQHPERAFLQTTVNLPGEHLEGLPQGSPAVGR